MSTEGAESRRLSRRDLIRIAGLSSLAVTGGGLVGPLSLPSAAVAASAQDDTTEGFLAYAYAKRAQVATTGNIGDLDALYDPANAVLLAHEKERASFLRGGLGASGRKIPVLGYTTTVKLIDLRVAGATAMARLYVTTTVQWIPQPQPIPEAAKEFRRQHPDRFRDVTPRGPRGEIASRFGVPHEVTLVKGVNGWCLAKDSYDEYCVYTQSPDLVPGSWAEVQRGGPRQAQIPSPSSTAPATVTTYCYNRSLALQCAHSNNPACGTPYNWNYCNYNSCGGDCANFVSQCLRAGGLQDDSSWNTNQGGCTCSSGNAQGTPAWVNNRELRNWLNGSGRATAQPNQWYMGNGDIINYAWQGGCDTGDVEHVVIVTGSDGNGPLVCSHNADLCDFPWGALSCGGLPFRFATFTSIINCF